VSVWEDVNCGTVQSIKIRIFLVGILLGPCRKCAKSKSRKLEQGFYCVYLQLLAQEWNHEVMTCNSTYC
jgi:hypothetical protein